MKYVVLNFNALIRRIRRKEKKKDFDTSHEVCY